MNQTSLLWDFAAPHIVNIEVTNDHIDHYGHVNNCEYVKWLEVVAWTHSEALGLTLDIYRELDRGMVVHRHEIDYLAPAYLGEKLQIATWIKICDRKLSLERVFQLQRVSDGLTLMRAKTRFICVQLSSGKPRRMPVEYIDGYSSVALNS